MSKLIPYPIAALARRMFDELDHVGRVFDLPAHHFYRGDPDHDLAVSFHGRRAASPLGPAAGPQSQMAQNIVLAWLGGSRIIELKTVQVLDQLEIPRPCIDMRTVGYNAEWSQELELGESLEEYVKASMLIDMLRASGKIDLLPGAGDVLYDMSVGYDLTGIQSPSVDRFIRGMLDATDTIERLRGQLPTALGPLRDLDFATRISDTVTLSTFHGCPPDEIERISEHVMRTYGLHCVVKFNPTLLGVETVRSLLHEGLGYTDIAVSERAFQHDPTWEQAMGVMRNLGDIGESLGTSVGAKFTNTLVVENDASFLPASEREVYLSGAPLHVLAMHLVNRFREEWGTRFEVSFSAGVQHQNFPDAVALGLVPVTVCTDLLRTGGYARQQAYYRDLVRRMEAVGATSRDEFIHTAYGGHHATLEDAIVANTRHYVASLAEDPLYARDKNSRAPRKIGSHLELFDCVTCDKCVPVCPNDANFILPLDKTDIPILKLHRDGAKWRPVEAGTMRLEQKHQIANFADFCNDCGNCDVFCPEDGGPYLIKPRFFGTEDAWRAAPHLDGLYAARTPDHDWVLGRFDGLEYRFERSTEGVRFTGAEFDLSWKDHPKHAVGRGPREIDLTYAHIMDRLREAVLDESSINYVNARAGDAKESE